MVDNENKDEQERQQILDQIAKKIVPHVPSDLKQAAQMFAKLYYGNVPLEDLTDAPVEALVLSVLEIWRFSLKRLPGTFKVRAYVDNRELRGKVIPQTIIEVVNDNMPFLVDSVTGAINSLGYSIHLVVHPVMQVIRDKNNKIQKIAPRKTKSKKEQYESFIHCAILEPCSSKKLKFLEEEVKRVLEEVKVSVEDWMPMRKSLQTVILHLKKNPPPILKEELQETHAFLEWIENNHFTFLGYCEYAIVPGQKSIKETLAPQKGLGILRDPAKQQISYIFEGVEFTSANRRYIAGAGPIIVTKASQISPVHRRDPMDSITIKRYDKKGNVVGLHEFIGLYTSVAYHQSARNIPLLRRKVSRILEWSGFSEQWHDGKTLLHILETFPRDELFQASEKWLYETCMAVLQLQNRQRLTLFIRSDMFERFVSCLVYVPRERYDSELREKIADILEKDLNGIITNWQTQLGELAFARIHFTIKLLHKGPLSYDRKAIEDQLVDSSLTWRDHLHQALLKACGEERGQFLFEKYGKGFSKGYQEKFHASEAVTDIFEIEQALDKSRLRAHLSRVEDQDGKSRLEFKIYALNGPVSLSDVLPVLENMNLNVLNEIPLNVTLSDNRKIWIHDFEARTREGDDIDLDRVRDNFLGGFSRIWREEVESDGFNRLILRANFDWRECQLIRAYAKYIWQLQVTFSQAYMEDVLAKYPIICRSMLQLFTCQFGPDCKEDRSRARIEVLNRIKVQMEDVENLDEDRILSKFINAISSTLRTNYYQKEKGKPKPYISFKIDCAAIDEMPLPRPMYEIFVHSSHVEAIHLRGGKVARGGIRWSDRKADFRTEILGLMKAQMVKNAVIVPVGSKGGFVVKTLPSREDKGISREDVVAAYKTMICGLLDLTDNMKGTDIIPPPDVIRRDEDDPYLVVAADRGTATFSDYANQISAFYDFWLGDAFASGGSTGYDHKKMGITARGAWESVKRHFREMGVDANREEITVVGIGDMSGDVFGNGMLLSRHLKLVAAFNHLHIFVDPFPDPERSYQERKRLFNLSQSSWANYNPKLISPGGGVFDRKSKSIKITPEMKSVFGIHEDNLTPPDLIRYILKAPLDLLWFGGIGTYIKSKDESNIDVGDRTNDALRVDGRDVRVKVIAEGANLGVTQLGRIEYAKNGGHINTDAIDNSAGVDCSDHEVNIKIPLEQAIKKGELTLEKRNTLLENMADDVARLVLKDNFWQNQVISLARSQGLRLLDEQADLMRDLESEGLLNRALESLPDETDLARCRADKQGLTRPELAILLAYAKFSLKHILIQSKLPDLDVLESRLLSYFPERLQHAYRDELIAHPLKREIVTTVFTNSIVNRMGMTFIHEMKRRAEVDGAAVALAYLIVRDLLELVPLWQDLEGLESLPAPFQTDLMLDIYTNVKQMTDWFIRFNKEHQNVEKTLAFFKRDFDILREDLPSFFTHKQGEKYDEMFSKYKHLGIPSSLSERLITLQYLVSAPDMVLISKETKIGIKKVAQTYLALGQQLGFDWLRKMAFDLSGETHWQQGAANALVEELFANQRLITQRILMKRKPSEAFFQKDGTLGRDVFHAPAIEALLSDLKNASTVDFAMMTVMNRHLRMLAHEG